MKNPGTRVFSQDMSIRRHYSRLFGSLLLPVLLFVTQAGAATNSSERFREVVSHLDLDGDFLLYVNADSVIRKIMGQLAALSQLAPSMAPDDKALFPAMDSVLRSSGLYSLQAVGVSVAPESDSVSRVRVFWSRPAEDAVRPFWRLLGGSPRPLPSIGFLADDTVYAKVENLDLQVLWALILDGVQQFEQQRAGVKGAGAPAGRLNPKMDALSGMFGTLADEVLISVQLSRKQTVQIPVESASLAVPAPSFICAVSVKDESAAARLVKLLQDENLRVGEEAWRGYKIYRLEIENRSPFRFIPCLALYQRYLLFASSPETLREAIACYEQKRGLITSPEFRKAFGTAPQSINGMTFVHPRLSEAVAFVHRSILKADASVSPEFRGFLEGEFKRYEGREATFVRVNTRTGIWIRGTETSRPGATLLDRAFSAFWPLAAMVALPSFSSIRGESRKSACVNNLRLLRDAKEQAAMAQNWTSNQTIMPGSETEKRVLEYIKSGVMPNCPSGGRYVLNALDQDPTCSQADHALNPKPAIPSSSYLRTP